MLKVRPVSRPRFLGSTASTLVIILAALVLTLWLAGIAWLLIDVMRAIVGAKRACP